MLLLGASTLALSMSLSIPALAQETGTETVTVTGSRVARQGFETPTPTTAIGSVELEQKAALTVTDIIAEIPSLAPNQNNNNSQNVGVSTFNLRNIGSSRTLVLIDGMRVADTNPTGGGFSINVIPAQLISHMDIVTGWRFRGLWLGWHHRCRQRVAHTQDGGRQARPAGHGIKLWR
jgi:outer membrane cobalamin receptor